MPCKRYRRSGQPVALSERLQGRREESAQEQAQQQAEVDRRDRGDLLVADQHVGERRSASRGRGCRRRRPQRRSRPADVLVERRSKATHGQADDDDSEEAAQASTAACGRCWWTGACQPSRKRRQNVAQGVGKHGRASREMSGTGATTTRTSGGRQPCRGRHALACHLTRPCKAGTVSGIRPGRSGRSCRPGNRRRSAPTAVRGDAPGVALRQQLRRAGKTPRTAPARSRRPLAAMRMHAVMAVDAPVQELFQLGLEPLHFRPRPDQRARRRRRTSSTVRIRSWRSRCRVCSSRSRHLPVDQGADHGRLKLHRAERGRAGCWTRFDRPPPELDVLQVVGGDQADARGRRRRHGCRRPGCRRHRRPGPPAAAGRPPR